MEDVTLTPDGQRPVSFRGEVIATSSSYAPGKMRWFELVIYRTQSEQYLAQGIGRSDFEDEDDKVWVEIAATAAELISMLHRTGRDGDYYLTRTTQYALEDAARVDSNFAAAYVVRI